MKFFIFILLILFSFVIKANEIANNALSYKNINYTDTSKFIINEKGDTVYLKKRKFTAIILAILTGPLGGHRLYLGTKPIVPIVYTITLGGGFLVIPVIDVFSIILTKDISKYINNDKIFMWINENNHNDEFYEFIE